MEKFNKLIAPQDKPVRAKIIRNVIFSGVRGLLVWPIPFLLIPFILGKLGTSGYGTWALCLTVINLTALADLGLGGTLTKFVAEYYSGKDFKALQRLLDTGLMLYTVVAALIVVVLWGSSPLILRALFADSPTPRQELLILWHRVVLVAGINILIPTFYSVVTGLQRMDLSNGLLVISLVTSAGLSVLFLCLQWGLRGLADAYLMAALLTLFLYVWITRRLLPQVRWNPFAFDWPEVRRLFSFSLQMYTTQMAGLIQDQIEKLYLAWFVGIVPVGWYNMAGEAALKIRRIPELLMTPILAAASELHAKRDEVKLRELYYRAHKYLALTGVPLAMLVALISRPLVDLWLGHNLEVVALPLIVLLCVNLLNLLTAPGFYIMVGKGVPRPGVLSCSVGISLNVVLSFWLIRQWGFQGAFIGTFVSALVSMGVFTYLFHRHTGYPYGRLIHEAYLKPVVCAASLWLPISFTVPGGLPGWSGLCLEAAGFGVAYLGALVLARFFDDFDLIQVERLVPVARFARKFVPLRKAQAL
ncbi:MAG: oligosaccharide flippase family protein [Acidobacteriia bacterium]|nr:oligosaccharide flippase family protein [Terriglobia bacterium]